MGRQAPEQIGPWMVHFEVPLSTHFHLERSMNIDDRGVGGKVGRGSTKQASHYSRFVEPSMAFHQGIVQSKIRRRPLPLFQPHSLLIRIIAIPHHDFPSRSFVLDDY